MNYKQIINNLRAYDYSKYMNITSYEKLMIYAAYVLNKPIKDLTKKELDIILYGSDVPLTFNYICIASFKLFPEKFCCDEEFKEFPSVDRLNRTMMHLKYVKKGKPYLAGSVGNGYSLTSFGKANAIEVESVINNSIVDKTIKAPTIDEHKKGFGKNYAKFIESVAFKNYELTKDVDLMFIWGFFNVIPFTQIKYVNENLEEIKIYAKENENARIHLLTRNAEYDKKDRMVKDLL